MKNDVKVGQFMSTTFNDQGGGERVMNSIFKALGARLYTFSKKNTNEEIIEIGNTEDKRFINLLTKI